LDVACGDDACFQTTIPEDSYPLARLISNYVLYQVNQSVSVRPSLPMQAQLRVEIVLNLLGNAAC
jgi:hypothetical protein